jgi:hypothetical protein
LPAKRLSAFDSVTLYGKSNLRPDIYGKLVMLVFLFVVWMMLKTVFSFVGSSFDFGEYDY